MPANIEKLLKMLEMEVLKLRESTSVAEVHSTQLELERFFKRDYEQLKEHRDKLYLDELKDSKEKVINGWLVEYKSVTRSALDTDKLTNYFKIQGVPESQIKELLYSSKETKKTIHFKKVK
jgi:hypothetical protein